MLLPWEPDHLEIPELTPQPMCSGVGVVEFSNNREHRKADRGEVELGATGSGSRARLWPTESLLLLLFV
jgi:hypothetical protein